MIFQAWQDRRRSKRETAEAFLRNRIRDASTKPLEEASEILTAAGIEYLSPDYPKYVAKWKIPKIFWRAENEQEKARALLTQINYARRRNAKNIKPHQALHDLFMKQIKKSPFVVIRIACGLSHLDETFKLWYYNV